jgi:putative transposase
MEFFFDFLPFERRLIRRDCIRLFNIHYWDNYLSPLAGRSEEPVVVKYDPRNLSRGPVFSSARKHGPHG